RSCCRTPSSSRNGRPVTTWSRQRLACSPSCGSTRPRSSPNLGESPKLKYSSRKLCILAPPSGVLRGVDRSARAVLLRDLVTSAVASCAAVTLTLAAKVIFSVPTLPELAQDKLVQSLPGPVFAFMLRNLLYLGKPMFFISLLVLQVVIMAAIGV